MKHRESQHGSPQARRSLAGLGALALLGALAAAGEARAQEQFVYAGKPVHPACVHALAMHQGDTVPVTTAVSLEGCATSERSRAEVRFEDDFFVFEDDALLGGGSFGYRELTRLENGILGLIVRRVLPGGEEKVSLAAVNMVGRPMMRQGKIVTLQQVELLGEVWIPGMDVLSFKSMGNRVEFVAGVGDDRVERSVDFTRLGRMRR